MGCTGSSASGNVVQSNNSWNYSNSNHHSNPYQNHISIHQYGSDIQNTPTSGDGFGQKTADDPIPPFDEEAEQAQLISLPAYTCRMVFQHNCHKGWVEWGVYKKRIYDNGMVKQNPKLLQMMYLSPYDVSNSGTWKRSVPNRLRRARCSDIKIHYYLFQYLFGRLKVTSDEDFWTDFRTDVVGIHEDLSRAGDINDNQREYLEQVQRWLLLYRENDPVAPDKVEGDLNQKAFPLPDDIKPEMFRKYIEDWERFDTEDPDLELREVSDISEKTDESEIHEAFATTLRPSIDMLEDFNFDLDDVQLEKIPDDLIKKDVTTSEQDAINAQRKLRTNLNDPIWMEMRRAELARSFSRRHNWNSEILYLNWAEVMAEGEKKFFTLCELHGSEYDDSRNNQVTERDTKFEEQ